MLSSIRENCIQALALLLSRRVYSISFRKAPIDVHISLNNRKITHHLMVNNCKNKFNLSIFLDLVLLYLQISRIAFFNSNNNIRFFVSVNCVWKLETTMWDESKRFVLLHHFVFFIVLYFKWNESNVCILTVCYICISNESYII